MVYALFKRWEAEQDAMNWRSGLITSAIYNTVRDPKKGKPFTPEDFMPVRAEKQKPMTVEATLGYVALLNAALGGVDMRQAVA